MQSLWRFLAGTIWTPDDDDDLQLRLCIIAHTGASGHRELQAKIAAISKEVAWRTIKGDVRLFVPS